MYSGSPNSYLHIVISTRRATFQLKVHKGHVDAAALSRTDGPETLGPALIGIGVVWRNDGATWSRHVSTTTCGNNRITNDRFISIRGYE